MRGSEHQDLKAIPQTKEDKHSLNLFILSTYRLGKATFLSKSIAWIIFLIIFL